MPNKCVISNVLSNPVLLHCYYCFCSPDYSIVLTGKTLQCQSLLWLNTGRSTTTYRITVAKTTLKKTRTMLFSEANGT